MHKYFGQALRIGVSNHGLALVKTSRWRGEPLSVMAEHLFLGGDAQSVQAIGTALRGLLAGSDCANWPVTFVLADELVRLWQVTPPPGSGHLADLQAAAESRFQTLYGEPVAQWKLTASWDARKPFLAAALPRPLLDVIEQTAAEHQLKVVGIVPQFVAGWNQWRHALKPGAWYGQVHDRVLTVGMPEGRTLSAVRVAALPRDAGPEWLAEHMACEALRLDLPLPELLQLSGQVPAAWNKGAVHSRLACRPLGPPRRSACSVAAALAGTGSRA